LTLREALSLQDREVVSLVGGGGKTTLMFALGRELSSNKKGILLTTTTKIWNPGSSEEFGLFCSARLEEVRAWVEQNLDRYRYLLIARERLDNGKLQGIPSHWTAGLFSIPGVNHILVEADGAAGRPLKAPREGEPVLPPDTTLLIPVVGIDVLGAPLDEEHVFRSRIAMEILKEREGAVVDEAMIGVLLAASLRGKPEGARVIPFINKVDLPGGLEKGRRVGNVLLRVRGCQIRKVILGQAQSSPVVQEILHPPGTPGETLLFEGG
jgi:probable selenium-dependent hydroxylase accessory protein YqeC